MKKLAVIAGGWHYPLHFFRSIQEQKIPEGWEVDLFTIGHRDPDDDIVSQEKKNYLSKFKSNNSLIKMDNFLYKRIVTKEWFEKSKWTFWIDSNTVGDYAFYNQWNLKYNYKDYDVIFLVHDDNLIVSNNLFVDVLQSKSDMFCIKDRKINKIESDDNWLYIGNGWDAGYYNPRGSFGFFKTELLEKLGGNFKIDNIDLIRTGENTTPEDHDALSDWNWCTKNFTKFMENNNFLNRMYRLSDKYRVSNYCVECERGFVSKAKVSPNVYLGSLDKLVSSNNIILKRILG